MNEYILERVLSFTKSRRDYRNFCLVSKRWRRILTRIFPKYHIFVNHLEKIVEHFPDVNWDIEKLASNRNLTHRICSILGEDKFYVDHASVISGNPRLVRDITDVRNHGGIQNLLLQNRAFTFERIKTSGLLQTVYDEYLVSYNPNVTWEHVKREPYRNWEYYPIIKRCGVRWDLIKLHKLSRLAREYLSKTLPVEDLTKYNKVHWFTPLISKNRNITLEYIRNNPKKNWYWDIISANPAITESMVRETANEFPWVWRKLAENPNCLGLFSFELMSDYYWVYISMNPAVTWDMVSRNLKYPWDFRYLSEHIDLNCILANPEFNWDYRYVISYRKDLKYWMVVQHPKLDWNWYAIAANKFIID